MAIPLPTDAVIDYLMHEAQCIAAETSVLHASKVILLDSWIIHLLRLSPLHHGLTAVNNNAVLFRCTTPFCSHPCVTHTSLSAYSRQCSFSRTLSCAMQMLRLWVDVEDGVTRQVGVMHFCAQLAFTSNQHIPIALPLQMVITGNTELTCMVQCAESQTSEQGGVNSACKQKQGI